MSATPDRPDRRQTADNPAVVVAGDALVDLAPARTADGAAAFQPRPGGSCLNVAAGLGRLGVPTALLARISDDHFGDLLRAHLAASGTRLTHVLPTSDPTTLAAVRLREDGSAAYSFHAGGAADRGLRSEHLAALPDDGALPPGAALHLGSLGLLLEPLASTLDGLVRREAGRRLVSLDPNVRPDLVTDRAAYLRRFAEWVALADVVKASDEDLAWLHPGEPYEAVADRWLASGAGLVLITFGSRGAWAVGRDASVHVPAPAVEVVDTVGAGDAFTAGALARLHHTGRLRACVTSPAGRTPPGTHARRVAETPTWLRHEDAPAPCDRTHQTTCADPAGDVTQALSREGVDGLGAGELARLVSYAVEIAADTCTRAGAQPPYRRDGVPVPS